MPWQCRLVDDDDERMRLSVNGVLPPGIMWHDPDLFPPAGSVRPERGYLSPEYYRDHLGKRPALMVSLPGGEDFCLDSCSSNNDYAHGWTVTGDAPNITVSPSINFTGRFHGFLTNGVLSEDVEGRMFPQ